MIVAEYDHILLDLDGCLWVGEEPTDRAVEAVSALRAQGKHLAFLTNDPREAVEFYVRKLWRLGFQASLEEVVTVGSAVQWALAEEHPAGGTALVVGTRALIEHVSAAGLRVVNNTDIAPRADVVVVSGHNDLTYHELKAATQAVIRGARLIGLGRDATFPMPDGPWPGSGAVLAAVETASGRLAELVVGKPEPAMFQAALERLGEGRALMIGDRLDSDIEGAQRAGIDAALVLTGATPRELAEISGVPFADSLADLVGVA